MSLSHLRKPKKRGSISEEEEKAYKAKMMKVQLTRWPLESVIGSSGHQHRRYLKFSESTDKKVDGVCDQFGLSKTATVPWF